MIEHNGIFVQRMSRQIDTYQFPLFIQTFQISPTLSRQNLRCCNIDHIFSAKQRINCSRLVGLVTVTITHQCFKENFSFRIDSKKLFTFQLRKTIKTTRQRKAFHILLITSIQVDPLYKIKDTLIRTICPPFVHDTLYCSLSYSFYSTKAKANVTMLVYRKLQVTFIHIRPQYLNTHCLTFIHQLRDIGNVRQASTHNGSHILRRIICFQISCLISHP